MADPYLTPDLVITTYKGSPIDFTVTPTAAGEAVADLSDYDQISWHWYSGSRDRPGTKVLSVKYTGADPNYITVVTVDSKPSARINIPGSITNGIAAGIYFAELWITPPGGEATITGWAEIKHELTTGGA